jgi:hypothetical protein
MSYNPPPLAPCSLTWLHERLQNAKERYEQHLATENLYTQEAKEEFLEDPSSVCSDPFGKTREESLSEDWENNKKSYEKKLRILKKYYDAALYMYEGEKKFYETHTLMDINNVSGYYQAILKDNRTEYILKRAIKDEDISKVGQSFQLVLKINIPEEVTTKGCWCFRF